MEENKEINAHLNQKIVTMEDNLNKKIDGLKNDYEHKWDNLQDSTEDLINPQQCPPEEECQSDTMAEEQCQQQPHEELIEDFIELSEGLVESSDMCDVVCPWEKEKEITALLTEEGSGKEEGEEPQEPIIQPNPIDLDPNATAQLKNNPLPVAPSFDQVYTLPAAQLIPKAPTKKATPSLPMLKNFKRLVAIVQNFATTSKKMAATHTAWHSGWFGCGFRFGAPGP